MNILGRIIYMQLLYFAFFIVKKIISLFSLLFIYFCKSLIKDIIKMIFLFLFIKNTNKVLSVISLLSELS